MSGSGHLNKTTAPLKYKPKSEWITSDEGAHPVLITTEEFALIDELINQRTLIPERARISVYPLSGLVRCKKCGRVHGFLTYQNTKIPNKLMMKPCTGVSPLGVKCGNRGVIANVVNNALDTQLQEFIKTMMENKPIESGRYNNLQIDFKAKTKMVEDLENRLDRLNDLYIEGRLTKAKYELQFDKMTHDLDDAKTDVHALMKAIGNYKGVSPAERIKQAEETRILFNSPDIPNEIKNNKLRLLIDKIIFGRSGDDIEVEVVFA